LPALSVEESRRAAGRRWPLVPPLPEAALFLRYSASNRAKKHAEKIRQLMIEGMKAVVPDVLVGVKYAATDRWYKEAAAVYDNQGKLLLWHPEAKKGEIHAAS
jgi:hypothetical protein